MKILKLIGIRGVVTLLLLWCLLTLAFQNMDTVSVRFLIWDLVMTKKIYLIMASGAIGVVVGVILGWSFKKSA